MGSWLSSAGINASHSLAKVATGMELETARTLIVVKRNAGGSLTYLAIAPNPIVELVTQQEAKAYRQAGQTDVEVGDYTAYVSRRYDLDALVGDTIYYLLDAEMGQPPVGGTEVRLVPERILEGDENFWHLILRERV